MKNNTLHQKHKIRYSRRQKHKIRYSRHQKHKPRNNKTKNSLTRRITEGGGGFFRSIFPVSKKKQRELEEEEEYKNYLEEKNKLAIMETEQALKIEEARVKYYAELEREKALAAAANIWPSWPPFVHDALKRLKGANDTPVENDTPDTTLTDTGFGRGAGYSLDEYRYW